MKAQRATTTPVQVKPEVQEISEPEIAEQIRIRAYELFELRGREPGHDMDDWFQAEAEVNRKSNKAAAA